MKHRLVFNKLLSALFAAVLIGCPNIVLAKAADKKCELVNVPSDEGVFDLRDEDEKVTVIIELDSKPLLERNADIISGGCFTKAALNMRDSLLSEQEEVRGKIIDKLDRGGELDLIYSYTVLTNAFATEMSVGQIAKAASVDGVRSVYIAPEFEALEEIESSSEASFNHTLSLSGEAEYTGKGTVISIIDTGIDLGHDAFANAPDSPKILLSDISGVLGGLNAFASSGKGAASYFYSDKIPFYYNYANKDFNVSHVNVAAGDHGTHVAGIAAGCAKDSEGNTTFSGVAPDAQIIVMKVFKSSVGGSTGAGMADLIAAIEDSLLLGADVINYSLGSVGGFSYSGQSPAFYNIFDDLNDAGIAAVSAAGNSYTSGYGNKFGNDLSLASNPDNGSIATPASFNNNFAVASFNTKGYIVFDGIEMEFTNNYSDYSRNMMRYLNSSLGVSLLRDSSGTLLTGTESEFAAWAQSCGISGKFVMVRRGQNFMDTVFLAETYGAIGLIVCNNRAGALSNMAENTSVSIPAVFISQENGDYIVENFDSCQSITVSCSENGQMSDFSSVGVTPELQLKPEISAVGGAVFSATDNNTYGLKSGTSMAAPYFSGSYAVILQYLNDEHPTYMSGLTAGEKKSFAQHLLMSTAKPMTDEATSAFFSPRRQGAGAVDFEAAMQSKAVLMSSDLSMPKLSLGDDKGKTGVYTMSFAVINFSDVPLQYSASATVLTEVAKTETVNYQTDSFDDVSGEYETVELTEKFMSGSSMDITSFCSVSMSDSGNISVPAGTSKIVTVTVTVGSAVKSYLDSNFENGIYIDGFITLDGGGADLSIPYLAFYGDWTKAPILDDGIWQDTLAGEQNYPSFGTSAVHTFTKAPLRNLSELHKIGSNYNLPNRDAFVSHGITFNADRSSLSSRSARPDATSDQLWNSTVYKTESYLLRSASLLYKVTNANTGEIYSFATINQVPKTYLKSSTGEIIYAGFNSAEGFSWSGKSLFGEEIPDGTVVNVELSAGKNYGENGSLGYSEVLYSFKVLIDATVPELTDVEFYRDSNNDLHGVFSAYDKHYINSIEVTVRGVDSEGSAASVTEKFICGYDTEGETAVYDLNITKATSGKLASVYAVDVEVDDWAGNGRFNNKGSGVDGRYVFCFNSDVSFGQTTQFLTEGESVEITKSNTLYQSPASYGGANDNSAFRIDTLELRSTNIHIAGVDSSGRLYGASSGTVTISYRDICSGVSDQFTVTVRPHLLQSMINDASPGDTLNYTSGSVSGSVVISKDLTIDLNGAAITSYKGMPAFIITNSANVTLKNGYVESVLSHEYDEFYSFLNKMLDGPSAIDVVSGSLTLSKMTVRGASCHIEETECECESVTVGNGVNLAAGAELIVDESDIYGFYAVNNEIDSCIIMVDGNVFGVLSAVRHLDEQSVISAEGSKLYDVSGKISDILSDGTYETSVITAFCAAVDDASYDSYISYDNGTLLIGLEFENTEVPVGSYGNYWIPSVLDIMKDGEQVSQIQLDGSGHFMREFTGMPSGEYSVSVSFALVSRLSDEQKSYVLNLGGALSDKLDAYDHFLRSIPSLVSDSLGLDDFTEAKDTLSSILSVLEGYFEERDLLGFDCPLTQEYAEIYTPWLEGAELSNDYGRTWSEYYNNYFRCLIFGGTAQVVTADGEYITPYDGDTFNGLLPIIDEVAGLDEGSDGGLIGELRYMLSMLDSYFETTAEGVAAGLVYLNDNIEAIFSKISEISVLLKADDEFFEYNPSGFDSTISDTIVSGEFDIIADGVVTSYIHGFDTISVAELLESANILLTFNVKIKRLEAGFGYLNFGAYSDCAEIEQIFNNALGGELSQYVSDGCISLFSESKAPLSVLSGNRIIYHFPEGTTNDNPYFYAPGKALILNDASMAGHSFIGWYTDPDFGDESAISEIPASASGDIELYARFDLGSYLLTFVADGIIIRQTEYQFNESINETAPAVPEKEGFIGNWDKYIPKTMPANDLTITAVYFAVAADDKIQVSADIIGGGRAGCQNQYFVTNTYLYFTIGDNVTLTAYENVPGSFLYWVRKDTNRIVSTDKDYSFIAASSVEYEAVFCATGEYHNITYQGSYGNILYSEDVPVGSGDINVPDIPTLEGRVSIGWDKDISDFQFDLENVLITALYDTLAQQYTVTLTNSEKVAGGGSFDAFSVVTITAEGEDFSYWTDDGGTIVSYQAAYSFIICFDCVFTAVFEGAVTPMPVIRISKVSKNLEEKNLTFYAERSIPHKYTILETGMILTNLVSVGENDDEFTLENPYILQGTSESRLNAGTYSVTITDYAESDHYYARGYVILKDESSGTFDTIYSATAVSPPDW